MRVLDHDRRSSADLGVTVDSSWVRKASLEEDTRCPRFPDHNPLGAPAPLVPINSSVRPIFPDSRHDQLMAKTGPSRKDSFSNSPSPVRQEHPWLARSEQSTDAREEPSPIRQRDTRRDTQLQSSNAPLRDQMSPSSSMLPKRASVEYNRSIPAYSPLTQSRQQPCREFFPPHERLNKNGANEGSRSSQSREYYSQTHDNDSSGEEPWESFDDGHRRRDPQHSRPQHQMHQLDDYAHTSGNRPPKSPALVFPHRQRPNNKFDSPLPYDPYRTSPVNQDQRGRTISRSHDCKRDRMRELPENCDDRNRERNIRDLSPASCPHLHYSHGSKSPSSVGGEPAQEKVILRRNSTPNRPVSPTERPGRHDEHQSHQTPRSAKNAHDPSGFDYRRRPSYDHDVSVSRVGCNENQNALYHLQQPHHKLWPLPTDSPIASSGTREYDVVAESDESTYPVMSPHGVNKSVNGSFQKEEGRARRPPPSSSSRLDQSVVIGSSSPQFQPKGLPVEKSRQSLDSGDEQSNFHSSVQGVERVHPTLRVLIPDSPINGVSKKWTPQHANSVQSRSRVPCSLSTESTLEIEGQGTYDSSERSLRASSAMSKAHLKRIEEAKKLKEQSEARHQILKEIRQAMEMRESAVGETDKAFWDKQIQTLNDSLKRLCRKGSVLDSRDSDDEGDTASNGEKGERIKHLFQSEQHKVGLVQPFLQSEPYGDDNSVHEAQPEARLTTVKVRAPEDLPEGYNFTARMNGQRIAAVVPKGGVSRGEIFTVPIAANGEVRSRYNNAAPNRDNMIFGKRENYHRPHADEICIDMSSSQDSHAKVRAPRDLPGGYQFTAKMGNRTINAVVPKKGVLKGEIFSVPILHRPNNNAVLARATGRAEF